MKFMAVVHKDEDSAFGVSFPDLPGCFGAGDTREEALESAKVSLREYAQSLEDMDQPLAQPRSMDELMADPGLREIVAGAEYWIEVPLLTVGIRKRINVSMDDRVLSQIDATCKTTGVNRSAFLTEVACQWLEKNTGMVSTNEKDLLGDDRPLPAKKRA